MLGQYKYWKDIVWNEVLAEKASGQDGKMREVFSFSTCYTDRVKRLGDTCRLAGNQVARPNILAMKEINL